MTHKAPCSGERHLGLLTGDTIRCIVCGLERPKAAAFKIAPLGTRQSNGQYDFTGSGLDPDCAACRVVGGLA